MRSFFRVINALLLAAALLAAAFCVYRAYMLMSFPADEYNARIEELSGQAARLRTDAVAARAETGERIAALGSDLRSNGEEAVAMADKIEEMRTDLGEKEEKLTVLSEEALIVSDMPGSVEEARRQYAEKIRELEQKILDGESELRICYWTLDDGPSAITGNFLDALDELGEHVHVTFFTANGANDAANEEEMLRREMMGGHSVQNHSFSHTYWEGGPLYSTIENFEEDIRKQDEWLFEVTGFHPGIFRYPGGSAWGRSRLQGTDEVIEALGYEWIDWNCNLYDAGTAENLPSAALEASRAVTQSSEEQIAIILSHDWNMQTLIALKSAVPMLQEKGYVFLPLFQESVTMGMPAKR